MTSPCPCRGCTVAYEAGKEEIIKIIKDLHKPADGLRQGSCDYCNHKYPCLTIRVLDGEK